jgi:hypothetical protein
LAVASAARFLHAALVVQVGVDHAAVHVGGSLADNAARLIAVASGASSRSCGMRLTPSFLPWRRY